MVATSRGSAPANTPSSAAASETVRPKGPTVSWLWAIGITPARLTNPSVGLIPTTELTDAGQTIEPSVSVPTATAARLAAMAAADPELEPQGETSRMYGLRHCPPRALHPLEERGERKLAHSLMFVLPRSTAPASRSRRTTKASRRGRESMRARDPAVEHAVGGVDVVLQQDGDAMQWPSRPT